MIATTIETAPNIFEREQATFEKHKAALLAQAEGHYAIIKGEDIFGIFPTERAALEAGTVRYPLESFYLRHIVEQEEPILLPSIFMELP